MALRAKAGNGVWKLLPALLAVIATAVLAGCGSDGETTTESVEDGPLTSALHYARSGGFAAGLRDLTIEPDGTAALRVTGGQGEHVTELALSEAELEQIAAQLAEADVGSLPEAPPSGCNDCFNYEIAYAGASYTADTVSVDKGVEPLFTYLDELVDANLPPAGG